MSEAAYNKMIKNSTSTQHQLTPTLPNLVTSTDETTIFPNSSIIYGKESFYIVSRPDVTKNECAHSGTRNHYKKVITGDSHCRRVRIVINSTFTAGGLSALLFVAVYGLTMEEMPYDDIVTISVPVLTVGSELDLYSNGCGFVTFVRGNVEETENENDDETCTTPVISESKEATVVKQYRTKIYHPFVKQIRTKLYGMSTLCNEIPEHLQAVSWMDGTAGQLKLITREEHLILESHLKITCNKHSAARTAVEQAADCGPMFKILKKLVQEMDVPHPALSSIYHYLQQTFSSLQTPTEENAT